MTAVGAVQHPKVVVIGAGSLFFGRQAIWQMTQSPHLNGGALALVDTDPVHLPRDAFLELLCDVDMAGPRPVGPAPVGLRGLWQQVLDAHELSAEAAVACDRELLLRAFLCDPLISSLADARAMRDALLEAERDALPAEWFQ